MRVAFLAVLLLLNLPTFAQSAFPKWVILTQEYSYPQTQLSSTVGMIEQAIGEDNINFVVTASDGAQLRLPKAYAREATAEEAARSLFAERNSTSKVIEQYQATITQYQEYLTQCITALKTQQSQGNNMAETQQALQLIQQLKDMNKRPDRRAIPNQNRYEVNVHGR